MWPITRDEMAEAVRGLVLLRIVHITHLISSHLTPSHLTSFHSCEATQFAMAATDRTRQHDHLQRTVDEMRSDEMRWDEIRSVI